MIRVLLADDQAPIRAGFRVLVDAAEDLQVVGEATDGRQAVDLAAYRIIQESLTNVIRHAGPAEAAVSLSYRPDELEIDVTDTGHGPKASTGPGAAESPAGHGLAGMRERAASVGGTVQTGPRPGGGYQVTALLPVHRRLTSAAPLAAPEKTRP